MRVGVVGAGATGLAAGHALARAGHDVTVLERNDELGGLAASIRVGGTPVERYYHHLFASDRDAIALIEEMGLGGDLRFRATETGVYYDGSLYPFGTPREILRFPPLGMVDRLRFAATAAYLKARRSYGSLERVEAVTWMSRYAGRRATDVVWKPLLQGKFGRHAEEITMAWLWARIRYRTFKLGYLRGGFDRLYAALAEEIAALGGRVAFGRSLERIFRAGDSVVVTSADGSEERFDRVIVTTPPGELARATGAAPDDRTRKPRYLGATCFVLELRRSLIPFYWLNVNDPAFPFLAVVEHTRMADRADYGGRHVVYVGNYVDTGDPLFGMEPDELLDRYLPYLTRLCPGFGGEDVLGWHFSRAPFAQPVVTVGYRDGIPPHTTHVEGVYLTSMAQVYPQDRGQNAAIAMGRRVAALATAPA